MRERGREKERERGGGGGGTIICTSILHHLTEFAKERMQFGKTCLLYCTGHFACKSITMAMDKKKRE